MSGPRRGLHAARIPWVDLALWDVVGTLGLAALSVAVVPGASPPDRPLPGRFLRHLAVWGLLALLLHRAFRVWTPITRLCSTHCWLTARRRCSS